MVADLIQKGFNKFRTGSDTEMHLFVCVCNTSIQIVALTYTQTHRGTFWFVQLLAHSCLAHTISAVFVCVRARVCFCLHAYMHVFVN